MYATVRRYEGVTDPREVARQVNEGFVPLIRQVPGFLAFYWIDAGGNVVVSTSIFEDQAGAEESNRRAADYVQQNMASLLPNPPQITAGGVVAHQAK
jgi:quinol monooxygenase YgiN